MPKRWIVELHSGDRTCAPLLINCREDTFSETGSWRILGSKRGGDLKGPVYPKLPGLEIAVLAASSPAKTLFLGAAKSPTKAKSSGFNVECMRS